MAYPPSHPAHARHRQGGGGAISGGSSRERYFSRLWRLTPDDPALIQYFEEKVEARRVADALLQQEEGQRKDENQPLLMQRDGTPALQGSVPYKDAVGVTSPCTAWPHVDFHIQIACTE